jgi:hypothetical protein
VTADHHVDAGNLGDRGEVARVADMGQRDDLVDPLRLDRLDRGGDRGDILLDGDVVARRGQFGGVVGDGPDDGDPLATAFEDRERLDPAGQLRGVGGLHVRAQHGKVGGVEEGREAVFAIVEFMIADGHGVGAHQVEELRFNRSLVGGVEQRALEIVTGIEKQEVLAVERGAPVAHGGDEAGPPKHFPSVSSSDEQVESYLLIDSIRLCQSLICRIVSV